MGPRRSHERDLRISNHHIQTEAQTYFLATKQVVFETVILVLVFNRPKYLYCYGSFINLCQTLLADVSPQKARTFVIT